MATFRLKLWLASAMAALTAAGAADAGLSPGYVTIGAQHIDIGVAYEDGAWDLHVHDEENEVEYAPDEALLYLANGALTAQPAGAQWTFIGAGAGGDVWVMPQVQDPSLIWIGIGGEELASGLFENDQVTLKLVDVRGPGQYSLWASDTFGNPLVQMSTFDGIDSSDSLTVLAGSHAHYNMGFTAAGYYEIDFEASGTLVDGGVFTSSGPTTYYFAVGSEEVPEASSLALMGSAVAVGGWWIRRRKN